MNFRNLSFKLFLSLFFLFFLFFDKVKAEKYTTDFFIKELTTKVADFHKVSKDYLLIQWNDSKLEEKVEEIRKIYPNKSLTLRVSDDIIKNISGRINIPVEFIIDNKLNRIVYIRCKVEILADALTSKIKIQRGEEITEANVGYSKLPLGKVNSYVAKIDITNALGKVAATTITENTVITSNLLKEKTVIFRGSQVTIKVKNGELTLTSVGEALQDGVIGQRIQVRITSFSSKKIVFATILAPDLVEINLGGNI